MISSIDPCVAHILNETSLQLRADIFINHFPGTSKSNIKAQLDLHCPRAVIDAEHKIDAYLWCEEHMGNNWVWAGGDWEMVTIYFLDNADQLAFSLRWPTLDQSKQHGRKALTQ